MVRLLAARGARKAGMETKSFLPVARRAVFEQTCPDLVVLVDRLCRIHTALGDRDLFFSKSTVGQKQENNYSSAVLVVVLF